MRTANAYTAKLKAEALGRTFKVQATNHCLFTTTLYRGAAGCGPVDFSQITYVPICSCSYLGPARRPIPPLPPPPPVVYSVIDGGNPATSGSNILDGGSPTSSGPLIVDGGV